MSHLIFLVQPQLLLGAANPVAALLSLCCRYLLYGDVSFRVAAELRRPEVEQFFARLIQRVAPKSLVQALAEVRVTRKFFENFSGDQVGVWEWSKAGQMHTGEWPRAWWMHAPAHLVASRQPSTPTWLSHSNNQN